MTTPHYSDDAVTIWHGNALALPIPDESVDLIVTSPPYFGLRSYTDGGEHYDGQIGSEPTPREFVDALIAATAEMVRVLKPSGSIWVNLGDKYYAGRTGGHAGGKSRLGDRAHGGETVKVMNQYIDPHWQPKTLMGLPWRYAIRCIDELSLILRAEVIWSKPNGLPESVTDRVRRSHETWFHMTKEPRYFSGVDEIREEHLSPVTFGRRHDGAAFGAIKNGGGDGTRHTDGNPLGKLPGSVREVPTQPLKVPAHLTQHFAAFPLEWPRRIIRGWSPAGICVECGEGRRPTSVTDLGVKERLTPVYSETAGINGSARHGKGASTLGSRGSSAVITGYACACPESTAPTRPAVILDPFGGTGTTALVAKALGRIGWHVDLSADYCRIAQWRVTDPGEMARAMQVEKPPAAPEDMDSLLDLIGDLGGVA